jgi:hypothetical protein
MGGCSLSLIQTIRRHTRSNRLKEQQQVPTQAAIPRSLKETRTFIFLYVVICIMLSVNLVKNGISFCSESSQIGKAPLLAAAAIIVLLLTPVAIDSAPIETLYAQIIPSIVSDENGIIPMCLGSTFSFIPVSTIGMVNCPVGTFPIVIISPLSVGGTSSGFIWMCSYAIGSELGFLGLDLAPGITLTNCIPISSQLSPLQVGLLPFQSQLAQMVTLP